MRAGRHVLASGNSDPSRCDHLSFCLDRNKEFPKLPHHDVFFISMNQLTGRLPGGCLRRFSELLRGTAHPTRSFVNLIDQCTSLPLSFLCFQCIDRRSVPPQDFHRTVLASDVDHWVTGALLNVLVMVDQLQGDRFVHLLPLRGKFMFAVARDAWSSPCLCHWRKPLYN